MEFPNISDPKAENFEVGKKTDCLYIERRKSLIKDSWQLYIESWPPKMEIPENKWKKKTSLFNDQRIPISGSENLSHAFKGISSHPG